MADAPERIWIEDERAEGGSCRVHTEGTEGARKYGTEYIRADVARADLTTVTPPADMTKGDNHDQDANGHQAG